MLLEYKFTYLPKDNRNLISISDEKHIYHIENEQDYFVKIIPFEEVDKKKCIQEVKFQKKAYSLGLNTPKIYDYYFDQDGDFFIVMERLKGNCLNKFYGGNPNNVPRFIWKQIREMVDKLYENGIEYVDITSMNFVKTFKDNKIYIIDFGHAYPSDGESIDWFLDQFLNGMNEWNPYYL